MWLLALLTSSFTPFCMPVPAALLLMEDTSQIFSIIYSFQADKVLRFWIQTQHCTWKTPQHLQRTSRKSRHYCKACSSKNDAQTGSLQHTWTNQMVSENNKEQKRLTWNLRITAELPHQDILLSSPCSPLHTKAKTRTREIRSSSKNHHFKKKFWYTASTLRL